MSVGGWSGELFNKFCGYLALVGYLNEDDSISLRQFSLVLLHSLGICSFRRVNVVSVGLEDLMLSLCWMKLSEWRKRPGVFSFVSCIGDVPPGCFQEDSTVDLFSNIS